ncbi:hypothetical protein PB2503_10599 [Parvularcula bermudensis HTCC2503]|uniref:Lipoprotein n=1 Tax=Parvularcula bermudensis (strain ATCC BAA-594 / HTCC2503 / KCTC 12087) TaxID=314260 RepID=E0TGN9_PARBH|nr:alpha/beta fold hydrolase [Parvularcula bermudensis]ADM10171.1 hypothetical protein PB2503_10599 [Parvularcula bermudensis HTCC2503]
MRSSLTVSGLIVFSGVLAACATVEEAAAPAPAPVIVAPTGTMPLPPPPPPSVPTAPLPDSVPSDDALGELAPYGYQMERRSSEYEYVLESPSELTEDDAEAGTGAATGAADFPDLFAGDDTEGTGTEALSMPEAEMPAEPDMDMMDMDMMDMADEPFAETAAAVEGCLSTGTCVAVDVLFGTNRDVAWNKPTESFNRFGTTPQTPFKPTDAGHLWLGELTVTVPQQRAAGAITRPREVMGRRIGFRLDPEKHFVFVDYQPLTEDGFASALADDDTAFVFIHGFNVAFKSAAMRAAQLKVDGKFNGRAIIYSWPTQHTTGPFPQEPYRQSRQAAAAARPHFRQFLDLIRAETDARKIHIVAHSMGNYMMMEVLAAIRAEIEEEMGSEAPPTFGEIVFAAPDVDRDRFIDLVEQIDGLGTGLTLYASSRDVSMEIARQLCRLENGDRCPPRAGDIPDQGPIVMTEPALDTIDVSNLPNRGFLPLDEHDYYGGDIVVLRDMSDLMQTGRRAPRSSLWDELDAALGRYWSFPESYR